MTSEEIKISREISAALIITLIRALLFKSIVAITLATILFLIAAPKKASSEDIYTMTKRIMMRNLYQSQLASTGKIRIISDSEKWSQNDKYLKYSLEFEISKGRTKRRCWTEITVDLETKAAIQIYKDYSNPKQIKLGVGE